MVDRIRSNFFKVVNSGNASFLWAFTLGLLISVTGLLSLAHAGAELKSVHSRGEGQFELIFDKKLSKNQLRLEVLNDVVQFVISDAQVYPAKIASYKSGPVTKIFAYQYAPNVIRFRLTHKEKTEGLREKIGYKITNGGKSLFVGLSGVRLNAPKETAPQKDAINDEEKVLIDQIRKAALSPEPVPTVATEVKAESKASDSIRLSHSAPDRKGEKTLTSDSRPPLAASLFKTMLKLLLIIALFALSALGLKKAVASMRNPKSSDGSIKKAVSKLLNVPLGSKQKMIEVVSSHYLGPKKSISVVKVAGRTLVLGVTDESINLITQVSGDSLSSEEEEEIIGMAFSPKKEAEPAGPTAFESVIEKKLEPPKVHGFRNTLRSRTESLKQL